MDEIDFDSDNYSDITARDNRYGAKAYALLVQVFANVTGGNKHASAAEILDEFKELTLDQYGPLSFTVLREWGVMSTVDVGEMMFNLVESGRIARDDSDMAEDFENGYDFEEEFLGPYAIDADDQD